MSDRLDPAQLWLGAFVGAQVLLLCFCVVQANIYRERAQLLHAGSTLMAVAAVQSLIEPYAVLPPAVMLLVPALAALQLMELMSHAGALRRARRWVLGVVLLLPLLAAGAVFEPWCLVAGLVLWGVLVLVMLLRTWRQCQPWVWWLVPGLAALGLAGLVTATQAPDDWIGDAVRVGGLLTVWAACTYLATAWRGRLFGETRARVNARNTIDPLTGLATPLVLAERMQAARHLVRRYGHPSVVMVVHIENLPSLAEEFGPEAAESAVLAAASRVRDSLLRDGDVAARLAHARIGVLVEGAAPGEAAATVATRILVAGLKEPLAAARAEYLRFRIVLAGLSAEDLPPRQILHKLNARMDVELRVASERRIVTMTQDELLNA
jgi:GGDEF domain-containing protein